MLGFEMRYKKRAKDYGIEEGHKTENGPRMESNTEIKKKKQNERYK